MVKRIAIEVDIYSYMYTPIYSSNPLHNYLVLYKYSLPNGMPTDSPVCLLSQFQMMLVDGRLVSFGHVFSIFLGVVSHPLLLTHG